MGNIFSTNKPVKHTGRNGFDLSSKHAFDMRPAIIRPVIVQDTVPNSSYRINCADLVRTSALQTAAFLEGKQELDFFFVPYSQLYSTANDIIFGRGDSPAAPGSSISHSKFPTYPLYALVYWACLAYFFEWYVRRCVRIRPDFNDNSIVRIIKDIITAAGGSWLEQSFHYVADQFLYDEVDIYAEDTTDFRPLSCSYVGGDVFKLLSSLGYGDYMISFRQFLTMVEQDGGFSTTYATDSEFSDFGDFVNRNLFDFLSDYIEHGASKEAVGENFVLKDIGRDVNLIRLFAYQKVFADHYRDSVQDSDFWLYNFASNMDYRIFGETRYIFSLVVAQMAPSNHLPLLTFLRCRRRSYYKDLSTGLYPSTQFGNYASLDEPADSNPLDDSVEIGSDNARSAYSVRYALAMQKYRETLMRAGNRTKDLLNAEFGVKSHYIDDHYPRYLGSFDGQLMLNKVDATADGGDYSVGDIAGNVFSSIQGKTIEFTCNDHGVIIGCMSFIPRTLHNAFGLNPFTYKVEQFDFYHEAFENLGLQPVSSELFSAFAFNEPETLGFSARYNEYKQNLDLAHDSFITSSPVPVGITLTVDGINSNYVCVKPITQTLSNLTTRGYILPSVMNSIFKSYDNGLEDGAHFQVILSCSINAVLPMSVMGLPQ